MEPSLLYLLAILGTFILMALSTIAFFFKEILNGQNAIKVDVAVLIAQAKEKDGHIDRLELNIVSIAREVEQLKIKCASQKCSL